MEFPLIGFQTGLFPLLLANFGTLAFSNRKAAVGWFLRLRSGTALALEPAVASSGVVRDGSRSKSGVFRGVARTGWLAGEGAGGHTPF